MDPLVQIAESILRATPKTFPQRVHNLPPELFDQILEHTFALDNIADEPLRIDAKQQIPNIMKVNSQTRNAMAQQLYQRDEPIYCANHEVAADWLLSLPQKHRDMLREVRIESPLNESAQRLDSGNLVAKMQWGYIMRELIAHDAHIDEGILSFKILAPAEKPRAVRKTVWTSDVS